MGRLNEPTPVFLSSSVFLLVATVLVIGRFAFADPPNNGQEIRLEKLYSHVGPARGAAFLKDTMRCVTTGEDAMLRIWNIPKMKLEKQIKLDREDFGTMISVFPDGKRVAIALSYSIVEVWDLDAERRVWHEDVKNPIYDIELSSDGRTLAVAAAWSVVVLDANSGRKTGAIDSEIAKPRCCRFSPDAKQMAIGYDDGRIVIWDRPAGKTVKDLGKLGGDVLDLRYTKNGANLASASTEKIVRVLDLVGRDGVRELKGHVNHPIHVKYGDKGTLISMDTAGDLIEWDVNAKLPRRRVRCATSQPIALAISPGGRRMLLACEDGAVILGDIPP